MAVGTYTLPICDGCKLPWLPVGWSQDSNPRVLPKGAKPLRCGKCKSSGWDREHNAEMRKAAEGGPDVQLRTGSKTKTEDVPEMSRSDDEGVERSAKVDAQPAQEDELSELREHLPTPGEVEAAGVLEMRERQESDAPPRLPQASGSGVAVPPLSPGAPSGLNAARGTLEPRRTRCKHRMTDCPICNPKEAA